MAFICLKFKDQTKESKISYVLRKRWRPPHYNKCNCPRTPEARGWGDLSNNNISSKTLICCPIWCSAARCLCQWQSMATMETRVFGQTSRARFISLLSESRINIAGTKLLKCITHISQPDLWIKDKSIYGIFVFLRALGLLLADGTPTVGEGKTFWAVSQIFLLKQL